MFVGYETNAIEYSIWYKNFKTSARKRMFKKLPGVFRVLAERS